MATDLPSPSAGRGQTREERWAEARDVGNFTIPCPFCTAPAGEPCVGAKMLHYQRLRHVVAGACLSLADSEQSDLRSRLAAAEARARIEVRATDMANEVTARWQRRTNEARAETERLRAGIQALADEHTRRMREWAPPAEHDDIAASLRSLLPPETVINE